MFLWDSKAKYLLGLLVILMAVLSGCGQSSHVEMNNYIMNNGLTVEQAAEETYTDGQGALVTIYGQHISGLKDAALEQQINERIQQMTQEMAAAPPPDYRGIKILLPEGAALKSQWINVSVNGNFNNILSLVFYRGMDYAVPGEEYGPYINQVQTLNVDLNTGKDITLAELFPPDSDYLTLLNTAIRDELDKNYATEEYYYTMSSFKQVMPFTGIKPEQQYALSPWGLMLYFDEKTPEFDTDFLAESVTVPNWKLWTFKPFAQGFYDPDKTLYADDSLQSPSLVNWMMENDRSINEYREEGGVYISITCQYSSKLPQAVQEKIIELAQVDPVQLEAMQAQQTTQESSATYEVMVWAQHYGDYISVTRGAYCYQPDQPMNASEMCYVYRADNGEAVELADLFQPGFDYQAYLKAAIEKTTQAEGQTVEALGESINWSVGADGLLMHLKLIEGGPYNVEVPYRDIGPENLVIFH